MNMFFSIKGVSSTQKYAALVLLYVVFALTVDTLSTVHAKWIIDWGVFHLKLRNGFEVSTFVLWFLLPFLFTFRSIDWKYFSFSRWAKIDYGILLLFILGGAFAVISIKYVPSLKAYYPPKSHLSSSQQLDWALRVMVWNFSWLIGWEYLLRYVLLTYFVRAFPRYGWWVVCLVEFLFHLQKAFIESIGMLVFSIPASYWTYRRRNVVLPFLVHLFIESFLVLFRLII